MKQQQLIKTLIANPDDAQRILQQFGLSMHDKILYFFQLSFMHGYYAVMWFLFMFSLVVTLALACVYKHSAKK